MIIKNLSLIYFIYVRDPFLYNIFKKIYEKGLKINFTILLTLKIK